MQKSEIIAGFRAITDAWIAEIRLLTPDQSTVFTGRHDYANHNPLPNGEPLPGAEAS